MPNQHPSSVAKILVAGYGAIGRTMVQQAPLCQWTSLNRSPSSGLSSHISDDLLNIKTSFPDICPDFLVYTATPDQRTPEAYQHTYVDGIKNLLQWAKNKPIKHLFFVSSTSVYGEHQGEEVDEQTPTLGASFTGNAILEGERLVLGSELPASCVRFGGIYGNGREMLLRHVKQGVEVPCQPAALTNRIHEHDCAGVLLHLMALAEQGVSLKPVYVAVDDDGADQARVYQFIAQALQLTENVRLLPIAAENLGKRCLNRSLKQTGYEFVYPSFVQGYGALIQGGNLC